MPAKSLATLSRPRLFNAIHRERLFDALDLATERPLTLVSGPPGAGKTTLLASYLESRCRPTLWYHVDSGDADPASFFFFLRQAAERLARRKTPLPLFTPEYHSDVEGFARRFFRGLFERLPDATVLALDNVHTVPDDSPLNAIVATAAAQAPEGAALVALSRREPPPAYAHLLANDLAVRLDGQALFLTEEETRTLVTRKYGLAPAAAAPLFQRTRGCSAHATSSRLRRLS
jgi:ATP/maltotriose-dependent transcriptional regulator MalT